MIVALPFLIPAIFLAATGNLLFRKGMRALADGGRPPASLSETFLHALRTPSVWIGSFSYVAAMGCWLQVLGVVEIGLVYPVFAGGAAVVIMVASVMILGERLELRRIVGAILMIAGIFVASLE